MNLFRRLIAAAAAFAFSGCILLAGDDFFLSGGGGGEDFPNTVNNLSKSAATGVDAASEWNQVAALQLPTLPDLNVFADLRIEPIGLTKGAALAKRSAEGLCDTTYYDYSELEILLYHRGRQIVCEEDAERIRRDTLLFWIRNLPTSGDSAEIVRQVKDSAVLIQAWGTVTSKTEERVQRYRAWNVDTAGALDEAEYVTTTFEGTVRTVQRARLYGRDGAYLLDNAPPGWYESLKTSGRDTLEWQRLTDVDGDSAFWNRNAREPKGLVHFERLVKNPGDDSGAAGVLTTMRAMLHRVPGAGDSLVPQWYFERRALRSGAVATFSFRGAAPDSVLVAGDTALIAVDTTFATRDSLVRSTTAYRLLLGKSPAETGDGLLTELTVERVRRRGYQRTLYTRLVPASPLPMGQDFTGAMSSRSTYSDGDAIFIDGTVDGNGMVLTLRRVSKGVTKVYRLVLDRDGHQVEMVELKGEAIPRVDTARADTLSRDTLKTAGPAPSRADTLRIAPQ